MIRPMRTLVSLAGMMVLAFLWGCREEEPSADLTATVEPAVIDPAETAPPPGPVDVETSAGTTILVVMEDTTIALPTIDIPPGPAVFSVINSGTQVHDLVVEGGKVAVELEGTLDPGQTKILNVDLKAGITYEVYCPIQDHRTKGQSVQLKIPR